MLTAYFLINRMPSSILQNQVSHSVLFPDQPLNSFPPCIFDCTCFVHILSPGTNKLSAKSTKCIFLGYSRLQKGYKCYSPSTRQYFVSADVTFFESSPFFSTSDSDSITTVLPIPYIGSIYDHLGESVTTPSSPTPMTSLLLWVMLLFRVRLLTLFLMIFPRLLFLILLHQIPLLLQPYFLKTNFPLQFVKVCSPRATLIRSIVFLVITFYLHHIMLLCQPFLLLCSF